MSTPAIPRPRLGDGILTEIADEADSRVAAYAGRDLPDDTGYAYLRENAAIARRECATEFAAKNGSWRLLLRKEYTETLGCTDPADIRVELIELIGVAAAWVAAIDSRGVRS